MREISQISKALSARSEQSQLNCNSAEDMKKRSKKEEECVMSLTRIRNKKRMGICTLIVVHERVIWLCGWTTAVALRWHVSCLPYVSNWASWHSALLSSYLHPPHSPHSFISSCWLSSQLSSPLLLTCNFTFEYQPGSRCHLSPIALTSLCFEQ